MASLQTLSESVTMDYILSENKYIAKIEVESVDSTSIFLPSLRHLIITLLLFLYRSEHNLLFKIQYHFMLIQAFFNVNNALVRRASENKGDILLLLHKAPVNKHVHKLQHPAAYIRIGS